MVQRRADRDKPQDVRAYLKTRHSAATHSDCPGPAGATREERVEAAGRALLPLAAEARQLGSKLALYNRRL